MLRAQRQNGPPLSLFFFAVSLAVLIEQFPVVATAQTEPEQYDTLIENGKIVDGTGNPWFYGDVAIRGQRIAAIIRGHIPNARAAQRVDASGLIVSPGFIDLLSSSDREFLLGDGRSISKVTQGITTEILGEGWTDAPVNENTLAASHALGISDPAADRALRNLAGSHSFGRWLEAMQVHGISPNVGSFLGAMTLRAYVKGMSMSPPTKMELNQMRDVMREAMEDGAFGLGSALIYPPGSYASTEELIEVCKAMAPYGGLYSTHIRSEGDRLLESLDEAIRIGRAADVPVEIYHLKAAGKRNWPKEKQAIAKINSARREGIDVQANMYPYVAGGTELSACLPPWALSDGKMLDNLRDPSSRSRIRGQILDEHADWENVCQLATPEGVLISTLGKTHNPADQGKSLAQIAMENHENWADALMNLLLREEGEVDAIFFIASEENLRFQLRQPWMQVVTDASGEGPEIAKGLTHPRAYGTFPKILGRYVRDEKLISIEEAVRVMSSAAADRLGIHDRGLLKAGMYADLVVFNPDTVIDRADFEHPRQISRGIEFVFVNGQPVVRNGQVTGLKPGMVLRSASYQGTLSKN